MKREQEEKDAEERLKRATAAAQAEAQRQDEERRQANVRHRRDVQARATSGIQIAIVAAGLDDTIGLKVAKRVFDAIADGRVPHVHIQF
jgi:hypothetical protein